MPLDRIQDKGDPRPETEKQFEKYGEQLFSVPISFDVDTTNNPKPSPAAITSRPKSRESLSDKQKTQFAHDRKKEQCQTGDMEENPTQQENTRDGRTNNIEGKRKDIGNIKCLLCFHFNGKYKMPFKEINCLLKKKSF